MGGGKGLFLSDSGKKMGIGQEVNVLFCTFWAVPIQPCYRVAINFLFCACHLRPADITHAILLLYLYREIARTGNQIGCDDLLTAPLAGSGRALHCVGGPHKVQRSFALVILRLEQEHQ